MTQRDQVALASRAFSLAAILGMSLVYGDARVIEAVLIVAVVAGMSTYMSLVAPSTGLLTLAVEAVVAGLVLGLSFPRSSVLLPYLVVLPLLAGLAHRLRGAFVVVAGEAFSLILMPLALSNFEDASTRVASLAPWVLTNLGAGLLGAWAAKFESTRAAFGADNSYEDARQLLNQLRTVTRRLSAGLDSTGMAAQILDTVEQHLRPSAAAVYVNMKTPLLVPLVYRGAEAQQVLSPKDPLVADCWTEMEPLQVPVPSGRKEHRHRIAIPLRVGSRMVGVVLAAAESSVPSEVVSTAMRAVEQHSLRLDTALVFDEIRNMATIDERQRLAREIHDGIAQEVASLGYHVDTLAATAANPAVAQGLRRLRSDLSRVVADLRLSIFDLRSDVSPTAGLGAALSDYVQQVGSKSDLTVHVSLNEAATRLPVAVETELFRIAQEAITNARKHAAAENLWVHYWSEPPCAQLTVRDDGEGLGERRDDSFGINIMQERAHRIDASLVVEDNQDSTARKGTTVRVTVGPLGSLITESR